MILKFLLNLLLLYILFSFLKFLYNAYKVVRNIRKNAKQNGFSQFFYQNGQNTNNVDKESFDKSRDDSSPEGNNSNSKGDIEAEYKIIKDD